DISPQEVEAELRAQYRRFADLVGRPPFMVNGHHHVQVLPGIGAALLRVLAPQSPRPYVRRLRETLPSLARVPGGRGKGVVLDALGRRFVRLQERGGFPGNDYLAGIAGGHGVRDAGHLARWLAHLPGRVVELVCHPGYHDTTLLGRDVLPARWRLPALVYRRGWLTSPDARLEARERELRLLERPEFAQACRAAGFALTASAVPALGEDRASRAA